MQSQLKLIAAFAAGFAGGLISTHCSPVLAQAQPRTTAPTLVPAQDLVQAKDLGAR